MRPLDLIVIADRHCPTSRTYLSYLRRAGLQVRKILVVDFLYDDARAARLVRRFGNRLGHMLMQRHRAIPPQHDAVFRRACNALQRLVDFPIDYFSEFRFEDHALEIEQFVVRDFSDPALHRRLLKQPIGRFLYTNGGRVPGAFLALPNVRILHIHPGVVPDVRGSDGLMWSIVARGRPGASCFIMDAGIDTGALIKTKEFACPDLQSIAGELSADPEILYAALLHAYDPHLRASLLIDVVGEEAQIENLVTVSQAEGSNPAYSWMHPRLRRFVLERLLAGQPLDLSLHRLECDRV